MDVSCYFMADHGTTFSIFFSVGQSTTLEARNILTNLTPANIKPTWQAL